MYSNILVPIALDNEDDRVAEAIAIAKVLASDGAKITLLHVVEAVPSYAISYISADILTATRKGIEAEMARLASEIGADSVVIEGHSGRSILDYAEDHGSDLIVIASHRPGMQTLLLGSTATHVVRHAQCAVHVLR
ncbi:universal stress protein [Marivita geojedonensis]|uniref:Universal stress protein n=1 Tax=Marivita geojedonensis TaxID=1123756 RepID=A0A1X4NM24_9RHOB|nr:universal stress protein [Marivita geojedonensis]OSQ51429.1 universal stress protein [Marivita geojedonensis]PRY77903.1 nucleotide-binding universal stress UspA family protein [Marivita geojedonensis]